MSSSSKQQDKFMQGFKPISTLNRPDGTLPFGYYEPSTEGKLVWHCGFDAQGKITSIYEMSLEDRKEKQAEYIDFERAKFTRDTLIEAGWKPIDTPNVNFSYADGEKLNRRQRKYLERKLKAINKGNPFG